MGRAFYLMLAGGLGALIAWAVREPSAPRLLDPARWAAWEGLTGVVLGLLVGMFLGALNGQLQGSRTHLLRGTVGGMLIGAISGGLGITLGSYFYSMGANVPVLSVVARAVGWAIFGGLIGLGQGVVGASIKRSFYGLVGGIIGGALGGLAFEFAGILLAPATLAVEGSSETGTIPRAIGFTLLGACIGLMIGVVETSARQAWVRLILGRNEGKDWAIFDDNTFLGRQENVQIPLFGDASVAPIHAVIQKSKGMYFLSACDPSLLVLLNGQPIQQAPLASGDIFQIGGHQLQFLVKGKVVQRVNPDLLRAGVQYVPQPAPSNAPIGANTTAMMMPGPIPTQSPTAVPAPTMSPPLSIVAQNGPLMGQRYGITGPTEVGRETGPIPLGFDSMTSRRHAALTPQGDHLMVTDLGSTNGILVNGTKVSSVSVRKGESFQIGSTLFLVE